MTRRLLVLYAVVALTNAGGAEAVASPPPPAFIRIHATFQTGGHGLVYHDQDFFLSRDHTATAVLTEINPTHPFSYWATTRTNVTVPTSSFQVFAQTMVQYHVGLQSGSCSITNTVGPDTGLFEVSWYGTQGARRSAFSIEFNGAAGAPPPCDDDVAQLYKAIRSLGLAIGVGLGPGLRD